MQILNGNASVKLTPAVLEAITVENGLIVDAIVPMLVPKKIVATTVIRSNPASKNTGIKIG